LGVVHSVLPASSKDFPLTIKELQFFHWKKLEEVPALLLPTSSNFFRSLTFFFMRMWLINREMRALEEMEELGRGVFVVTRVCAREP